ncbi:MAG: potassium-transporting ATPase subunit KdpC [Clostridia bacterium]
MKFLREIKKPILVTLVLLLVCGLLYPLALTGMSQVLFPHQANGSLVKVNGRAIGSELVGQDFTDRRFMRCRPSAYHYNTYTNEQAAQGLYAGLGSGSSNYGPSSPALAERVQADLDVFLAQHPSLTVQDLPADLMTASGSGLDPHISPKAAAIQIPQLVSSTGLTEEALKQFVADHTESKWLGIFGEETINVLGVNLEIAKALKMI